MKKICITTNDGHLLSALYEQPLVKSNGAVIISSAIGIRKEFYLNFAHFLVMEGYTILLYDYRGIGESAPEDLRTSMACIYDWGKEDMNAALDFMVAKKGFKDIIWLGHSLGAQLIGMLQQQQYIKKVVSVSAAVGYWGYFPFPKNIIVWLQWYVISPLLVKIYGYGPLKKVGWGENIPKNVFMEWRKWCMSKTYYRKFIEERFECDKFYRFVKPITAVYTSDDFIANDRTVSLMVKFFPNAPVEVVKIPVEKFTKLKAGHTGIFRKRFKDSLWPVLLSIISESPLQRNLTG